MYILIIIYYIINLFNPWLAEWLVNSHDLKFFTLLSYCGFAGSWPCESEAGVVHDTTVLSLEGDVVQVSISPQPEMVRWKGAVPFDNVVLERR